MWPIVLARVLMGLLWLYSLRWKLPPDFDGGSETGLREWLELEVAHPAFGFYADLIDSVVLPNFTLFAWLVFFAELVVGFLLLTGTFTRLAAFLGGLMSFNLLVGLLEVPGEWPWAYVMMMMWHGTFLVAAAGRVAGVDGLIRSKRRPSRILDLVT